MQYRVNSKAVNKSIASVAYIHVSYVLHAWFDIGKSRLQCRLHVAGNDNHKHASHRPR